MTRSGTRDASSPAPVHDRRPHRRDETGAGRPWRTSTYSCGSCVQAQPVDATVRDGMLVLDGTPLVGRTEHLLVSAETVRNGAAETPAPRAPWYVEHGMLGEVTVVGVAQWSPGAAASAARDAVGDLDLGSAGDQVATLVRSRISTLLADNDPRLWDSLLERGELHAEHGRLVWIRPEPVDPTPADQVAATALRSYDVRFASTSSTTEQSRTTTSTLDAVLFTAVALGTAVASSQVVGLPTISGSASTSASRSTTTSVVTGRKLFVSRSTRFLSGVRFRVFVDGTEVGGTPGTVQRGIALDLPSVFTTPDEPRPVLTAPARQPAATGATAQPLTGDEVLHAIDLTPVVAAEQARLRSAGVAPADALAISTQLQDVLNERNARNTSRWWLTTGSAPRHVSTGMDGRRFRGITGGFSGHFRVRASVRSLQRLGTSEGVPTRADLGTGRDTTVAAGGSRTLAATVSTNTTGFVAPSENQGGGGQTTGIAPLGSVTLGRTRAWSRQQGSKTANHTVLNVTARQTRYRAVLDVTVVWESTTNNALESRPSATTRANSELGVPHLGARDALEFERRLLGAGTDVLSDDPSALVHALPRPRGTVSRVRPAVLDSAPVPGPREPLALASRKGLGFAVGSALPGSEIVAEHLSTQLREVARRRNISGVDWAVVHRELVVNVGTPRLEADLEAAITGIKHTVRLGRTTVHVMVRLHLGQLVRTVRYPAVTNTRAVTDDSVSGRSATGWAVQGSVGGGVRVSLPATPVLKLQPGPLRLIAQWFRTQSEQFGVGTAGYRRLENVGDVDEHTLDAVYESMLSVEGGPHGRHVERWWTHDPGNVVATVLVPSQHVPDAPVTSAQATAAGQISPARWERQVPAPGSQTTTRLPSSYLDLGSGAAAVYPAFLSLPALGRTAAGLYAQLHHLSGRWLGDEMRWPVELHDLGRPSWLAARFGALTGPGGVTVELPEHGGARTTINVMLRAEVRSIVRTDVDTEIEQYSKGTRDYIEEREQGTSVGAQAGLGFLSGFGAYATVDDEPARGDSRHDQDDQAPSQAGGRLTVLLHGGVEGTRSRTTRRTTGFLDITRATYGDAKTIVRTDPIFRLEVTRTSTTLTSRGPRPVRSAEVRSVRFSEALDVMLPARRAREIVPSLGLDVPTPTAPRRTYAGIGLPRTSVHTEQLRADRVLDTIMTQLTAHGVVKTADGAVDRTDPVRQALQAMFSSDALVPQMPALLTSGVWAWLPVQRSFGGAGFLWVRVTIDQVGPATATAPRTEVKLTLRGESLAEEATTTRTAFSHLYGGTVHANGGRSNQQQSRHGGVEARAGWLRTTEATATRAARSVDILRLGTRDKEGSYEFEHPVTFRVETALVDERSEAMAVLADVFSTMKRSVPALPHRLATLTGLAAPLARPAGQTTQLSRPARHTARWRESGTAEATARLLVPYHLTREVGSEDTAPPVFRREIGRSPRWEPATATAQQPPASFVEHLHPGDVNADAIQHWAWVAAHAPASADARPVSATTDNLEPFHDLAYLHDTSHGAVRPRIAELLTGSYPVRLGSETIHVGIELRAARDLLPDQIIESKARRYRQAETAAERTRSEQSGWFVALGPEGGAPMGPQASAVTRAPYERKEVTGTKASAKDNSTHETNKEGTLRFRHFTFDVTLVARRATAARTILRVDVPNGLTGALPVEGSGLVGGLDALVGELLSAREAEPPPTTAVSARTGSEVVWRASSHSDGVACVSATVVLLRPRRQIGSSQPPRSS